MKPTTDFEAWFDDNDPFTEDDLCDLHLAITHSKTHGRWNVTRNGETLLVGANSLSLLLSSQKAQEAFLRHVQRLTANPGMDIEAQSMARHAR